MIFSNIAIATNVKCLDVIEQKKIADAITELQTCRIALTEKTKLIDEKLLEIDQTVTVPAWQEPSMIIAGVAVSFAAGSLFTYALMKNAGK